MDKVPHNMCATLKRLWMRYACRNIHYSGNYSKLNAIYALRDPWQMDSPQEKHRFSETNRIILENYGSVGSILEIGCGEGHQSAYLTKLCTSLTALDISARAVTRARSKSPGADFIVADIFSEQVISRAPYDLVIACEVLYYAKDIPRMLQRMREIGRVCLVTYFEKQLSLDQYVFSQPGVSSELIEFGEIRWRIAWWSSTAAQTL